MEEKVSDAEKLEEGNDAVVIGGGHHMWDLLAISTYQLGCSLSLYEYSLHVSTCLSEM